MFEIHCSDVDCFKDTETPLTCNNCDFGDLYLVCRECGTLNLIEGSTWRYFTCKGCPIFIRPTEHTTYEFKRREL